jgi:hypothetical protein
VLLAGAGPVAGRSPVPAPSSPGPPAPTASPLIGTDTPDDLFTAPADPLSLELSLAKKRIGKTIGPKGGTLKAKARGGTTYTLSIPRGALAIATRITMTPVTGIAGFPDGAEPETASGVELLPDGLVLAVPATLQLEAKADASALDAWAMSTRADGTEAGFELFNTSEGASSIRIDHFSSYFMVWPLPISEARSIARRLQSEAEARFASELALLVGAERQRQMVGESGRTLAEIWEDVYPRYVRDVITPRLAVAGRGCIETEDAFNVLLAVVRQSELLGLDGAGSFGALESLVAKGGGTLAGLLDLATTLCFKEAYEFCRQSGDFPGLIAYYLGAFARFGLFGLAPSSDQVALAHRYLRRCGRFRLKLATSWLFEDDAGRGAYDEAIETSREFHLRWEPGPWDAGSDDSWGISNGTIKGKGDVAVAKLEQRMICSTRISDINTETQAEAEVTGMTLERYELPIVRIQLRSVPPRLTRLSMRIRFGKVTYHVKRLGGCSDQSDQSLTFGGQAGLVDDKIEKADIERALDSEAAEAVFDSEELKKRKGLRGGWEYRTGPLGATLALDFRRTLRGPGGSQTSRSRLEIIIQHDPE